MQAIDVRKTITKLACGLKTHKLSKIATEEYIMPIKNISQGFLSALKGFTKDSITMLSLGFSLFI
jgi:hypothetical protein